MDVKHDKDQNRFFILNSSSTAEVEYRINLDNSIDIYRTFVPESLRGQGLAAKLANAVLDYAKQEGLKPIPSCSYIDTYIKRNKIKTQ